MATIRAVLQERRDGPCEQISLPIPVGGNKIPEVVVSGRNAYLHVTITPDGTLVYRRVGLHVHHGSGK